MIPFLGAGLVLFCACTRLSLPPEAYSRWIQDAKNGLCTSRVFGDYLFRLQYKPHEYIALMDGTEEQLSKTQFLKNVTDLDGMHYLTLSISSKDRSREMLRTALKDPEDYSKRLNYFLFQLQKDLYLLDGNDSIPCVFAHFERSYALLPDNIFLLAFPKPKTGRSKETQKKRPPHEWTLVYRDKLLNTGNVRLVLKVPAETKIPLVKL